MKKIITFKFSLSSYGINLALSKIVGVVIYIVNLVTLLFEC